MKKLYLARIADNLIQCYHLGHLLFAHSEVTAAVVGNRVYEK